MVIYKAEITDWAILKHPEVYTSIDNLEAVFAKLDCGRTVALFGRAKNAPRYNPETGAFEDGHRLVTSPIIAVKDGIYHTADTMYTTAPENKNPAFAKWCDDNQYTEIKLEAIAEKAADNPEQVYRHICEVCGKEELLTAEEGYDNGWDYPPKMGAFKVISPRTCGNCSIEGTLWWEMVHDTPFEELSERHQETAIRITNEPESILPDK
jgi:hypothetical protein